MENYLKSKGLTRNRWGALWKGVDDIEVLSRTVGRLQDVATSAHQKIYNSNVRINALEKRMAVLARRDRAVRQQARESVPSRSVTSAADQLGRLEARVNALTVALG